MFRTLVVVIGALLVGCPKARADRESAKVELKGNPRWESAQLVVRSFENRTYLGPMGGPSAGSEIVLELRARGSSDSRGRLFCLEGVLLTRQARPAQKARFEELKAARPRLKPAPDGHALAASFDDGKTWRYVGLDLGDGAEILYCPHRPLMGADPFAASPGTRQRVLEILSSDRDAGHAQEYRARSFGMAHPLDHSSEYGAAFSYVEQHPADEELVLALATWLTTSSRPALSEVRPTTRLEVRMLATEAAQARVLAALRDPGLRVEKRADLLHLAGGSGDPKWREAAAETSAAAP